MELSDLNPEQRQAVEHDQGPILVIAGAGTGKTQVITRRVAHLVATGRAKAHEILALTFTDKAAREMEERLDIILPYGVVDTRVMTFHAFGSEILNQSGIEIGLDNRLGLLNRTQQLIFLRQHLDDLNLAYYAPLGNPVSLLGELANYFSRLREELITPIRYLEWARAQHQNAEGEAAQLEAAKQLELAQAYQAYQKLLRQEGLIDFSDQVCLALELLEQRPNLLKQLQKEIKYILVDEFQDTNLAQARLVELLAGTGGNIMVVGDDDQSIYKFRGAAISNILEFSQRYPEAKTIVLTRNYRSTQEILDSAYQLIQHNNPERLETKHRIDKRLKSTRRGRLPQIKALATLTLEADELANDIAAKIKRGISPSQIAVLVRKKKQANVVIRALEKLGITYQYGGEDRLFEQPVIKVILSLLQQIANPSDNASLYYLLTSPFFRVDVGQVARLAHRARQQNQSLDEALRQTPEEQVQAIVAQLDEWRTKSPDALVGELLYLCLKDSGYLQALVKAAEVDPMDQLALRNLAKFFSLVEEFQRVAVDKTVSGYVNALGLLEGEVDASAEADLTTDQDSVQIMTVHRSKGLEFEQVYLFDLTSGTFPSSIRSGGIAIPSELLADEILPEGDWHLAEERRLMYVAMTRAKSELTISYSFDHGGARHKKPSSFLAEAFGHEATPTKVRRPEPLEQINLFALTQSPPAKLVPEFIRDGRVELSVQQIDDYLTCPFNFYWKHVLHVPQPTQPTLAYGTAIHGAISYYYGRRRAGKVPLKDVIKAFRDLWRAEGYPSRGQLERRAQAAEDTLKRFYEREEAAGRWPSQIERSFNFELPGALIRGRFDAVYEEPGGVEIRDFKTSQVLKGEKAALNARGSLQLATYALGWQKLSGQIPVRLVLDYVETGQEGVTVKSAEDLSELESQIQAAAKAILAGSYPPGKSHFHCIHDKL